MRFLQGKDFGNEMCAMKNAVSIQYCRRVSVLNSSCFKEQHATYKYAFH